VVGSEWSEKSGDDALLGLVVGATDPDALRRARKASGDGVWILAPGVGAQGGNLLSALEAGLNTDGNNMLVPVSRGISRSDDPSAAAKELRDKIQEVRKQIIERSESAGAANGNNKKRKVDDIAPYQREFLQFCVNQGVLKFGSFVLKSGRTSPYFFNAGLFATGCALYTLGQAYASTIISPSSGL